MKRKQRLVAILTLSRIPLALGFLFAAISAGRIASLLLVIIAIVNEISDASDGWLARHFDVSSAAGGVLDSGADQIVRSLEFAGLVFRGAVPLLLLMLFVCRDSVVMSLRQLADLIMPHGRLRTRLSGKLKGIAQGICLVIVSANIALDAASRHSFHYSSLTIGFEWLAGVVTVVSLADYAIAYGRVSRGEGGSDH